ncbi:MAG: FAD-binding oxidoreductase [Acidimicrobiales bacterium]
MGRSWWGWGLEDQAMTAAQVGRLGEAVAARFPDAELEFRAPTPLDQAVISRPKVTPPPALASICRTDLWSRASHTYGRSYRDVVRGHRGEFEAAPSFVATPGDEGELSAILDWCADNDVAAVPYGGGSSVVGGIECEGAVSIDMSRFDRVLEVDRVSRAARIQAGTYGPAIEDQLRPHGLTLRHFPQSFEFSTLGGWLATRAGGHYASVYTHIDDLVESIRAVTPQGPWESRRLPGSGAGPSPDRLLLGSEGTLGVITEAWMRVQDRVRWKASAAVRFATFAEGAEAVRSLSQSALFPTNCRLLDAGEAMISAGVTDGTAVLVLGFESADHPVDAHMARAIELVSDHGGTLPEGIRSSDTQSDAAGAWKSSFVRAPYTRDGLVQLGVLVETFETAIPWSGFAELHSGVTAAVNDALRRVCGAGTVTCRFTHVYPDGVAPYFSFLAPACRGAELEQWADVKAAASEAVMSLGGTITHHHGVGRDHLPWYDEQRPELFAAALSAIKSTLDPAGILNPGILL